MNSSFFKSSFIILFFLVFILIFSFFNMIYSDESVFLGDINNAEDNYATVFYESNDSGFLWPAPNYNTITSYFGYRKRPTSGASTYHSGIDIGAPNRM